MATKQPTDHSHFILPDLGEGVHEAELIKWRVSVGDTVKEHQTIAEMETDKALVEVPSPWAGVIQSLNGNEGDIINVGSILVNYDIGTSAADSPAETATGTDAPPDTGCVVGAVQDSMTVPASFARTTAEPETQSSEKASATPAVRRIAKEKNIDINAVTPTGRGGRVTASDIESHGTPATVVPIEPTPTAPLATRVSVPQEGVSERIPFRGIRRKIAEAMMHSINTTAHFQVMDEADVTQIDRKRKAISELIGRKLSMLPFVMTAVTKALKKHPAMNSTVDDFVEEILLHSNVHLGCAVDTDNGLMVPVIKNADALSPVQLADETTRLAKACRDRSIPREELSGGTFTISNVGSYGGMFSTPIINYPEVGILGVGRSKEQVLTKDGAFYAGKILPLSLSCDHRVVDGAEAARFLRTIIELLENPEELIPTI
ncbi:MAG TPA: 2-oxo acid dehydrogenase subunit E2 [Phycisphaerales bacterium]|nr:2-oxo acid dehydrogenase subunit E2 [Phycisphaerales bacterium]HIB51288.1 2-oxo acid dehydrogenase subunit E2 [Phycisphaerales bacterium]HIN83272.1 2-oxo acid dehydrogenase subunit E2 [Phycisphaerales bacterium]HIO19850.1 2-oxo acid dehydrogenase subunit E2 [Phycisphaerales bacterium]HIO52767.1 2-oxo acid dehydrogenase subunit E2 [Phycisphaerales bacterium]